MARFEDAIRWVQNGGVARRNAWASIPEYTNSTPPLNCQRQWKIWQIDSCNIINGWGGQVGAMLDEGDPIRDGQGYSPTDDDRLAADWELLEKRSY